ncbi:WD40-repeat-containing domain protein [Sporodiniella umbellata]|nr:WD40-repeat-containing domain protein [Sporodiniella umbellata]
MKTQAAFPYALDISFANPNQLAMGLGDNSLKLWNFQKKESIMPSKSRYNYYTADVIWKNLYAKILRVACHPSKPDLLAFADEIGRVGIYDTSKQQNCIFKTHQNSKECPLIVWGLDMSLALNDGSMLDTLITCNSNGMIYVHDSQDSVANPIILNDLIDQRNSYWTDSLRFKTGFRRTAMAANKNFIAFGHMDGVVEVYSLTTLKLLYISTCHNKEITALDLKDNYLVTGCQQGAIIVHDLTKKTEDVPAKVIPEAKPYKAIYKHTLAITTLKWSHDPNVYIFASGSEDSFVFVWEMEKLVSIFDQHRASVLSLCWDWNNYKRLFTSSVDRFIYDWDISDFTQSEPKKQKMTQNLDMMSESELSERKATPESKGKKCLRLANVIFEGRIEAVVNELQRKEISDQEREDPIVTKYLGVFEQDENVGIYDQIFGDKEDVVSLIEIEEKSIQTQTDVSKVEKSSLDRFDKQLSMNIMLSQASTLFSESSDNVTDWIVLAMSPQAGKSTWCNLMRKQGKKMERLGKYHLAASCYIACSHIYEAVEVYQNHNMFREAIALAKIRLPEDKDLLSRLFLEWANYSQIKEDYELAAIW